MKASWFILFILLLFSCEKKSKFTLDEKSAMAQRMLDMHDDLKEIQFKIKSGESLGEYPEKYDDFALLDMTDESMREEGFEAYAMALLASEKALYEATTPEEQKLAYQQVVNNCVSCHQTVGCPGPIPKIKKLMWQD